MTPTKHKIIDGLHGRADKFIGAFAKADPKSAVSEIKADAADQRTKIVQWLAALMMAQAAAIAALVKFL